MRRHATAAALALVLAACTGGATGETDPSSTTAPTPTTTTTVPTTTTTADPDAVCDELKLAVFDLEHGMSGTFADLSGVDESQIDEEAVGSEILGAFQAFFDRLGSIAELAPAAVAEDLATIASVSEGLQDTLDGARPLGDTPPPGLDPANPDPEISAAASRLSEWTERHCGSAISVDPSELIFTVTMSAALGAFGDALGDLGGALGDLRDLDGLGNGLGDLGGSSGALVYGDDPDLDAAWDACDAGDGGACEDLWFSGFGEYEVFAQTCGERIPFLPAFQVDCSAKLTADGPSTYGDDPSLDETWDHCASGDEPSCDALVGGAPLGSEYETFGASCGERREGPWERPCTFEESGEPFVYGDDPALDGLWDACSAGDEDACSDLFFDTPFDSAYERFGSACGDLVGAGASCDRLAGLLGGPVG